MKCCSATIKAAIECYVVAGCRRVKFVPPVAGKRLVGHVFLNLSVGIYTPCEHRCVMEKDCVSVNIGSTINNKVVCELSDSDAIKHPGDLKQRNGWTYRGTEVRNVSKECSKVPGDNEDKNYN